MSTTSNILPPIGNSTDKNDRPLSLGLPSQDWAANTEQAVLGHSKTTSEPASQSALTTHPEMVRGESTRSIASTIALDMPGSWGKDKPESPFRKAGADGPDVVANDFRGVLSTVSEKAQSMFSSSTADNNSGVSNAVNPPPSGVAATGPPGHPGNGGPGIIDQVRDAFGNLKQSTTNVISGNNNTVSASGGVGDLPGRKDESGVARLPEERLNPDPTLNDTTGGINNLDSTSTDTGYAQQVKDSLSGLYTSAAGVVMGGQSAAKTTSSTGGVGDLPGTKSENDIARLPEERNHPDPTLKDTSLKEPIQRDVKEKYDTTGSSDQSYLQQARDTLGNLYANATGATVGGPGPVKLDKSTGKPFQTREVTRGGVGDLLGDDSEVSVPEKRAHPDPYAEGSVDNGSQSQKSTQHTSTLRSDNNAGTGGKHLLAQPPSESIRPATSDNRHAGNDTAAGILASALDSKAKKTDVPVDKTVRGIRPVTPTNPEIVPKASANSGSGINDPSLASATAVPQGSPSRSHHISLPHNSHHDGRGVDKTMGRSGVVGEKDGDSHFPVGRVGADHVGETPSSPKMDTSGPALSKTISGPTSPTKIGSGSNFKSGHGRSASTSSTGKPSFMDKVKGEMKVISGKITRDERKVEEGKVLKSVGRSATPPDGTS